MLDEILLDNLVASPPQVWRRRIDQAAIIASLAERGSLTSAEIEEACSSLGIGRRNFYKLLKQRRLRLRGGPPRGYRTGIHFRIGEAKEKIIAEAIAVAGPAAKLADVYEAAVQLSNEREVEPPSETSVRTRFGKRRSNVDLVNRLKLSCNVVADLCPLELTVTDAMGTPRIAWFMALIDARTRRVVSHELYAGQPKVREIGAFLMNSVSCESVLRHQGTVGLTTGFIDLGFGPPAADVAFQRASNSRKLVSGIVIKAIFGRTLGRIRIRIEQTKSIYDVGEPVTLPIARAIVARAVRQAELV